MLRGSPLATLTPVAQLAPSRAGLSKLLYIDSLGIYPELR